MKLTIIGNGFDLHHKIPSNYYNFKNYVQVVASNVFHLIEEYFCPEDFWNDFEAALAYFDYDTVLDQAAGFLMSYGADNWSDSGHHDYEYEIERVVSSLTTDLQQHFCNWIHSLPIPNASSLAVPPLRIDRNSLFLNFNYTQTLTKVYGVSPSNILYIHGVSNPNSSNLILGHGWAPRVNSSLNSKLNQEEADIRVLRGNLLIDDYFQKTFKPTTQIIQQNNTFFKSLSNISEIDVMGHSLAEVDRPYFVEILKHINTQQVKWRISYYSNDEVSRLQQSVADLGLAPVNVSFLQLPQF